ncbi:hypothetical protein GCM10009838_00610 [Catenulispora subtropica]|uniref:Uncharacterized protein n=1 Tax=Catenulispora subtropica TaxID=450798 RepID=A0ABN2QC69_9ACTN
MIPDVTSSYRGDPKRADLGGLVNPHGETESESESVSVIRASDGLRINLSSPHLGHPDKPGLWEEIHLGNTRNGELVCGKGHPKSVRQRADGSRWAYHLNKGDSAAHGPSPEHEAMAEWVAASATRRGLRADLEHSSAAGRIRSDVYIDGGAHGIRLGVEIQYSPAGASPFNPRSAVSRTTRIMKAGVSPLWVAPSRNRTGIAERLPSAITNDLPIEVIRSTGTIEVVSGPGQCDLQEHRTSPDACPKRRGRRCTGWHPRIVPMQHELGSMIEKAAGGELIIIRRRARLLGGGTESRLHYVPPAERDKYLEHGGLLEEPLPTEHTVRSRPSAQPARDFTDKCSWGPVTEPVGTAIQDYSDRRTLEKICAFTARGGCQGEVHLYINGTWCLGHRP